MNLGGVVVFLSDSISLFASLAFPINILTSLYHFQMQESISSVSRDIEGDRTRGHQHQRDPSRHRRAHRGRQAKQGTGRTHHHHKVSYHDNSFIN